MTIRLIPGFDSLTRQQLFDISLNHLRTTRVPSRSDGAYGSGCKYTGTGCAAAPFILPDDRLEADFLPYSGWKDVARETGNKHEEGLISRMQKIHDNAPESSEAFMAYVEERFQDLAKSTGLVYTPETSK